jgi:hypothetical protein
MRTAAAKRPTSLITPAQAYWLALAVANLACLGLMALLLYR